MNGMKVSRRQFLAAGLGTGATMLLTGCGQGLSAHALPGAPWPDAVARPDSDGRLLDPLTPRVYPDAGLGSIIPRSQWAKATPMLSRINPMRGINRITIHHEGAAGAPVYFADVRTTAARLETIRRSHLDRMTAGDIGYHFIIDRAGRVWEGRDLAYQGAHVKDNNEHNIGVMVLGNFDIQSPSTAQLDILATTIRALRRQYRVSGRAIHTHQELKPTACPGKGLQPKIVAMRANRVFI